MKIYVVTKGCYSDYSIITATTNRQKAKQIALKFSDQWEEARVEEYEDSDIYLKPLFGITFDCTGTVIEIDNLSSNEFNYDPKEINRVREWSNGRLRISVSADTAEAAIKIASEKKAEYLAEKAGIV